jgi:hypothetical protein
MLGNASARNVVRRRWLSVCGEGEDDVSIVTNDELVLITGGLKQGAAQIRWIERNLGFKPPRKADGHPLLTWEQINAPHATQRKSGINWTKAA